MLEYNFILRDFSSFLRFRRKTILSKMGFNNNKPTGLASFSLVFITTNNNNINKRENLNLIKIYILVMIKDFLFLLGSSSDEF